MWFVMMCDVCGVLTEGRKGAEAEKTNKGGVHTTAVRM